MLKNINFYYLAIIISVVFFYLSLLIRFYIEEVKFNIDNTISFLVFPILVFVVIPFFILPFLLYKILKEKDIKLSNRVHIIFIFIFKYYFLKLNTFLKYYFKNVKKEESENKNKILRRPDSLNEYFITNLKYIKFAHN